jgi:hypothetical protein
VAIPYKSQQDFKSLFRGFGGRRAVSAASVCTRSPGRPTGWFGGLEIVLKQRSRAFKAKSPCMRCDYALSNFIIA